ncbi:MAG: haloacid dehalogenase type II [Pseudomonadota bacterium]
MPAASIRYITFDCYGTLIDFAINAVTRPRLADRLDLKQMNGFLADFSAYRFDEVLGPWKPYDEVLRNALERTCHRWSVPFRPDDAEAIVDAVPSWGPHADVPAPLARIADAFPLVILSNAANDQIQSNVSLLGAPFHAVFTAEQAGAYKPRFKAFEFMFDSLGCGPEHVMHVSSSIRYDLRAAADLKIARRIFVDRGHGPGNPAYGYEPIGDLSGLPGLLGLQPA